MQKKYQTYYFFKIKQIKKKYSDIMVVYVKISKKYIEVNENNIIVSCFVTCLSFYSYSYLLILSIFYYFAKQFHFKNKMTF